VRQASRRTSALPLRLRRVMGHLRRSEDGVSVLEYVLLVALVAMLAFGALVELGRGSASPAGTVSHVAVNAADQAGSAASPGGGPGSGTSPRQGAPWCTSGQDACVDPLLINGQRQVIDFSATGGTGTYTYKLDGTVPPFVVAEWRYHRISVDPTSCSQDPGDYSLSLVVSDTEGHIGELSFTLDVGKGSLCAG
jgi:Flp pilus assembly pilin Flp